MSENAGRRALLIAPRFFGYEKEMADELGRRGYHVDQMRDRPLDTPLMQALTREARTIVLPLAERYHRRRLEAFRAASYDVVLVVNGQTLSRTTLQLLRGAFPRAAFVLYLWDSGRNRPSVLRTLDCFDRCLTAEPEVARQHGMQFRPLFYAPGFEQTSADALLYDLTFIGTMHTDRYAVVHRIRTGLSARVKGFWYLYVQAPWVFHAYRILNPAYRGARRRDVRFQPLPLHEVQRVVRSSRSVLDIEHPQQHAITMRAIETIGAGRKLITTNADIRSYDLFDPHNICVIDRAQGELPEEFIYAPATPVAPAIRRKYCLAGWMDDVLNTASAC